MKVALCYHGIAKGKNFKSGGLKVGVEDEFELFKKNVIEQNPSIEFDVFVHSWSVDHQSEVDQIMHPIASVYEPTRIFKKPTFYEIVKEKIKKNLGKVYEYQRVNNIYSRWYSFQKVCDLVKKSDIEYDLVIVLRFDMVILNPIIFKDLDKNHFYSGNWIGLQNEKGALIEDFEFKNNRHREGISKIQIGYPFDDKGLQDFFFISSFENMVLKFSTLYGNLPKMLKKYGTSNHFLALGQLKENNLLGGHKRILEYGTDYFLSRWL